MHQFWRVESEMETQDDSIDIARLQRVALGLESIPSQPFSHESGLLERFENSHSDRGDLVTLPHPDDRLSISASKTAASKSVADVTSGERENEHNKNAIELLTTNRSSPRQKPTRRSTQGLHPAKMSSADALPSDTQVISQSAYDELLRQNKEAGNGGLDDNIGNRTLMTLHEGDSGHLDLFSGFGGANMHPLNTDENDDHSSSKLGDSSPLTYEPNPFPESQRFVAKTPVTATKQGHVEGVATVSPLVSRNPLVSDLESTSGIMALSQVFKATQAPSSPLVNGPQSDLMSDRPSPNIPIQTRPVAPSLSSPLNTIAATFPRDSSETPLNYITMKESQANRDHILKEGMTRSVDHIYSEDQSDGEFEKEPSFIERMRRQKRIDQEATAQFAALSAQARPSSRRGVQPDKSQASLSAAAERRDCTDETTRAILETSHGHTSEFQAVGTSEEETEQEEDLPAPIPRFQVPNSSAEEDKENCNDLSTASFSHAASAHDRLSQALSFHKTPLPANRNSVPMSSNPRSQSRNGDDERADGIRSSPTMVVKDSQWSPYQNDEVQAKQVDTVSPGSRSQTRQYGSQRQSYPAAGQEDSALSPVQQQFTVQTFVPESQQPEESGTLGRPRRASASPSGTLNRLPRESTLRQASVMQSSNSVAPGDTEIQGMAPVFDSRAKSSSMPSRVAETPVHQRPRSCEDKVPDATIPETSPNHRSNQCWTSDANNETADQEDDDLPPLPRAYERAVGSQPVTNSSSPIKALLNSKILSSPSGRQRRALTEIAADASPQVGLAAFDVDINILSADDQEFRSAVAISPSPPRKKRRGNHGQNIYASDPVVPVTPRPNFCQAPIQEDEEVVVAPPRQPTEPASRRQSTFPRQSRPSRRAESFWDTEDSPKFRVSSKERLEIFSRSSARERQPPQPEEHKEPEREETPRSIRAAGAQDPQETTPIPEVPNSEPAVEENPADRAQQLQVEDGPIALNQVLAPWRGQKRAYFPATCFGKPIGASESQYLVKFEDSAPVEVPTGTVKRLELRIGDAVKVDMPNVPKVTHIIRGFADKLSADDLLREAAKGVIPMTDVYGHCTVTLGPKQRKSLPNGGLAGAENVINVPISRIYLDTILWNQLKDRSFTYSSGSGDSEWPRTPSERLSTPTSPSTRLSRSIRYSNGLFSGMVFAVSYGDNSYTKTRITKMILENDGRILEGGFNELFELPSTTPLATPAKSPEPRSNGANSTLRLKAAAEDVGFACLIADKHSRRPKYMQALALNLPCLSDRWVEDCVMKGQVVDWEMYLLPAGESSYLNGATKSRILTPYPATKARLSETVSARPNLLNGQSVLLITGRSGKADEERRKAYIFLTYALGASKIERVPDIHSARAVLNQGRTGEEPSGWDWIYIDDDGKVATKAMSGSSAAGSLPSRKRRKSRMMESISGGDLGLSTNVRIVGNEFVCQSLILGRLVEQ